MSGVKGKSGRKRVTKTRERALQSLTQSLPKAVEVLIAVAEGRIVDKLQYEAAKEIKDSVMGRPSQSQDLRIKTQVILTADDYELATRVKDDEQKLLQEWGEVDAIEQGQEQGEDEVI